MDQAVRDELPVSFLQPLLANPALSEKEKTIQIVNYLRLHAKNAIIRDNALTLAHQLPVILDTFTILDKQPLHPASSDRAATKVQCVICWINLPTTMLWPCSHLCFCFECKTAASTLTRCPICREQFTQMIDVKLP